jgi:methionyl aminopeptidase
MAREVPIHSAEDLGMARQATRLAAEVLGMIEPHVVPGVSTEALDRLCHDHIVNVQGAIPANLGYLGYPKTILTSVPGPPSGSTWWPSPRTGTRC